MRHVSEGARVVHAVYGPGTVLALVVGRRVKVRFDGARSLPFTVRAAELEPAMTEKELVARLASRVRTPSGPEPAPSFEPGSGGRARMYDARQAIEAIRLGVVPARHVRDYTVSREAALAAIDALLAARRGLRIVWGDYGAGKTHLLDVIETNALERNLVTARIALDPEEVPPEQPQRLFRALVSRFRLPGEAGQGLTALLDRLVESPDHYEPEGPKSSRFFSPYLWARRHHQDGAAAAMEDYLLGEPVEPEALARALRRARWAGPLPLALSDFRTYGRVYLHLFGVLACWARDAGYGGILLLLDEVEYVEGLGASEARQAQEVLDHFAAATLPASRLAFDPEALYKGGHEVHRRLPLVVETEQPLSVVLAATPLDAIRLALKSRFRGEGLDIDLTPLREGDLIDLVSRLLALYRLAYPGFTPDDTAIQALAKELRQILRGGETSTRSLVRATVSLCDVLRLRPPERR